MSKNNILEEIREKQEKERTMNISIREGSTSSVMSGVGDSFISPYALALGANNLQIGLLSSFVGLVGPISQILGSKMMENYSRKRIIIIAVALQALMWLPILVLGLFFTKGLFINYLPIILIVFYSIYAIFGSIGGPAWFSLMGDIVPENIRGRYFSKRNRICGTVLLVSTLIASFFLDYFKTKGYLLLFFSALFFIAGIARTISAYYFTKHYYPEFKTKEGYYFTFLQFVKKAPFNNFGKFTIYVALINFTVQIAGPFFTVYMLKDLNFSYLTFTIVNMASSVFSLLIMPLWGKISDKYGNREMLKIGSIIIPFIPFLWLFSNSPIYLVLVPQLLSGIGWAAFNLAAGNFIYDIVTPQRRGICVAYYNILNGIGIFMGAMLGGLLATYLTIGFMNKLLFIFAISGVLRLVLVMIMIPMIKEVRSVKKPKKNVFLYFKEPLRDRVHDIANFAERIVGKG